MATVVVAQRARADLVELIRTRNLPADARERVRAATERLESFPLIGKRLTGRWRGFRVVLGPWAWMLVVYVYDEVTGIVTVVAFHHARTISSATTGR